MNRTVFSLPGKLHHRIKAAANRKGVSMAALIRETLEETMGAPCAARVAEVRTAYVALQQRPEEADETKRLVISLPDELLNRLRFYGQSQDVSMAAYIRSALEERILRERAKPSFGAFTSGFTDTAKRAGEIQYEPRSWR